MKFYDSLGPNPKCVRMFLQEKGMSIPTQQIDVMAGENRQAPYTSTNPTGTVPALELDNGQIITEITAICEYLEDLNPEPTLIGRTPEEKAETRMWTRRVDLGYAEPRANAFRYGQGLKMFQDRVHCIPQAVDDLKQIAERHLAWLDGQMAGKTFIVGDRLTLADILLYSFVNFAIGLGDELNPELQNIVRWYATTSARASAHA